MVVKGWRTKNPQGSFSFAAMQGKPSSIADFSSQEAGQRNKDFHGLVCKFLCIFYQGLPPPPLLLNRFRRVFCTGNVGRVDPTRQDHSVVIPPFFVFPAGGGLPVPNLAYAFFWFRAFVKCQSMSHVLMAGQLSALVELRVMGGAIRSSLKPTI